VPFLLRTIRKSKWYNHEGTSWLAEGELQADALDDLKTINNSLSVWLVDDNRENLEQVVIAFAANRSDLAQVDYVLFDKKILSDLNIKFEKSPGDTPNEEVNLNWHMDLVELTASKRFELAMTIMAKAEKARVSKKTIERQILEAVKSKQLNLDKMDDTLQTKIRPQI
jgi:ribosome recycling factor